MFFSITAHVVSLYKAKVALFFLVKNVYFLIICDIDLFHAVNVAKKCVIL